MVGPSGVVLGRGALPAEDELRMPRPPGVIRRFWSRHLRWADALLVVASVLMTLGALIVAAYEEAAPGVIAPAAVLSFVSCVALLWRRSWPLAVFVVALSPLLIFAPVVSSSVVGPAPVIALYSVAVYRSSRAAMWSLGIAAASITLVALAWALFGRPAFDTAGFVIGTVLLLAIGALIGVNVGSRKRYVDALIDRSRQLAVERDQQARLAAAAERTRIAREMHDIVSHSLTVVVALADGAGATDDVERAREASGAIATTAREALAEMRVMLGVLRADDDESPQDAAAPREPLLGVSLDELVAAAGRAGFPVALTVAGAPRGSAAHRLAVLRIVQEGLTNAMRHSHDARYIRALIDYSAERILVRVENDGARSATRSTDAGWGLQGLRERVTGLGGTIAAGFVAPDVWRLSAELPLEESDA